MTPRRVVRLGSGLLAMCGLLTGCASLGGDAETGGTPSGAASGAEVRFVLFGDPTETAGYEDLVAAFEADNPDVDVVLSPVADQDDLLAKLTTSLAGGRPPDVFLVNYRNYGQFASQEALAPVQPRVDASEVINEEDFAPAALDAFRFDGEELT